MNFRNLRTVQKKLTPIFRAAQSEALSPVIAWIKKHGVKSVPVESLIVRGTWRNAYLNSYKTGSVAARKQYRYQKRVDGMETDETKDLDLGFLTDVWTRILRAAALDYSEIMGFTLDQTSIDIIKDALGKDYKLDIDNDTQAVRLVLREIKDKLTIRTDRLSRTEATTIAALGNELGARSWIEQSGGVGYRMWFGRIERERPSHLAVNDTIIKLNESYIVGGEACKRPGDLVLSKKQRINCRCSESFMTELRYNQYVKRGLIKDGKVVDND